VTVFKYNTAVSCHFFLASKRHSIAFAATKSKLQQTRKAGKYTQETRRAITYLLPYVLLEVNICYCWYNIKSFSTAGTVIHSAGHWPGFRSWGSAVPT